MARLQLKGQIHLVTVKERTDNGREREIGQSIRTRLFGDIYLTPLLRPGETIANDVRGPFSISNMNGRIILPRVFV